MSSRNPYPLGILDIERGGTPPKSARGGIFHPDTFDFPLVIETVEGGWVEDIVRGNPALQPAFIAAAHKLVAQGAVAITSTCGFSIRHQEALAAAVNVPVVTSSLLLLPLLLRQLPQRAKVAVLTYDSTHCSDDLLGLADSRERARVVIGGIEGGKYWHDGFKRPIPPTDVSAIKADVSARIAVLREAHPEIAAILFECTAFPAIAGGTRRSTNLPIYDITDLCRITMASVAPATAPNEG